MYLTNNIQRCGGLQCEHYISDFKIYVQVINKLKCGNMGSKYTVNLKLFPYIQEPITKNKWSIGTWLILSATMPPQRIISSGFEYSFKQKPHIHIYMFHPLACIFVSCIYNKILIQHFKSMPDFFGVGYLYTIFSPLPSMVINPNFHFDNG